MGTCELLGMLQLTRMQAYICTTVTVSIWGAVSHFQRPYSRWVLQQRWAPVLTRQVTEGPQSRLRLHPAATAADGRKQRRPVAVVLKSMPRGDGAHTARDGRLVAGLFSSSHSY